ncbi:phage head closure protein [Planomicrobium soli]|uniref:phage head closure protein n=1 Tax=Planomicrobium soli TaxID=1176648 RepID=UPI0015E7866B|nr:phage head closure protein [Planomicrobium soli]
MVQRQTTTSNGFGGTASTWTQHLKVDGVIDMLAGNEVMAADALDRSSSHIMILFDIVDIKRGDRVIDNGEQYRVTFVDNPMNLNRQLEINLLWERTVN